MRRRHPPIISPLVAIVAVTLLAAGCGSNSPRSPSSSGGHATEAQLREVGIAFSNCMRSHGQPNFPDAGTSGFKDAFDTQSPAFWSAERRCARLVPGFAPRGPNQSEPRSQAQIAAMLAFARCIRSHGFPSFPDPTSSGQLTHEMLANAGINLHQPAVLQAGDACTSVTHGVITRAIVARFVAGQ